MAARLLTQVVTRIVNNKEKAGAYGVSILNLPHFDYAEFVKNLKGDKGKQVFFLGFTYEDENSLKGILPIIENVSYSFSIEDAEESRNSGNEDIFRVLVIKRAEIEKLSSLRWFHEVTVDMVYDQSCQYVMDELQETNSVINSLIHALKRKSIRDVLGFERVLEYLQELMYAPLEDLPNKIKDSYYKLGLLRDNALDAGNPSTEDIVSRIKKNHRLVERIGNLEQAERQSITNYYANGEGNKSVPRLILQYYAKKDLQLLNQMELSQVEECLKAAKKKPGNPPKPKNKTNTINPTSMASQMIFEGNAQQIHDVLAQLEQKVDNRSNNEKRERVDIEVDGTKMQIKAEPVTERIATELTDETDYGGIIYADVQSPDEAIADIDKYEYLPFTENLLDRVWESLRKIGDLVADGESISQALRNYLDARKKINKYRLRLQDAPMFPVLADKEAFTEYLVAYEKLLISINSDFSKIWQIAPSNAKEIVNTIISMDNVFVEGENNFHAMPTPLNPLFLWKYIKLADEILDSKGVESTEEGSLSDNDKNFIIRKADDIPDPLSVMLLPATVHRSGGEFLPLTGRIGNIPIYSTNKQINQSESGIDALKQSITRYLCLYPHAGMMLKISIIDPPSVELMVSMLKKLNNDREFNISGIDVSIYRTKEATNDWIEINDDSINDGMLGQVKGKRSLNFRLKIGSKKQVYSRILSDMKDDQHIMIIFDPNEVRTEVVKNDKLIHIHPLCIPKVYKYNPVDEVVEIRPANEGDVFSTYGSIVEKLNEHPSSFSHTSSIFNTPIKRDTYDLMLNKADWLIILDQNLKSWDISLRAASEKLFYREDEYRSIGIYSKNCKKFIKGYRDAVCKLGNFVPQEKGIANIISAIRSINDDGLLSIVSHSSNRIFDANHGKGSLGLAIAAIHYLRKYPDAILVGLDTQLAQEWLSGREDNQLPDLIGIRLEEMAVDIVEVKTYRDNDNAFIIDGDTISGHAVVQSTVLEGLIKEIFGSAERITTVSRREILREQVYETLFQTEMDSYKKHERTNQLNALFAGEYKIEVSKQICFVDFENGDSRERTYKGKDEYAGNDYLLNIVGSREIQAIISAVEYVLEVTNNSSDSEIRDVEQSDHTEQIPAEEQGASTFEAESGSSSEVAVHLDEAIMTVNEQEKIAEKERIVEKCNRLNKVFKDYGISALPVNPELTQEASRFTRFTVELKSGETVRALEKSKADIGIQLEANGEILVNHIRGTKYISVDVPFAGADKPIKLVDHLDMLDGDKQKLNVVAGQTPDGKFEMLDISKAPHLLVAGTTGSGKTIFLYSIIVSLLQQFNKDEIEFLIVDPKQTDFVFFEDLPNLYGGKVITDAEEALEMLNRINEQDKEERMQKIRACRSRDINSYNEKNPNNRMKRLVVIIDEYADLIQTAEMQGNRKEFERSLSMLAQKVRSLGIHLIIATQRPSANIVTGVLKANSPYRISFRLPSHTDSQTILDMSGAENLLGMGDMLMVTESDVKRMQGLFITEEELTEFAEGYMNR